MQKKALLALLLAMTLLLSSCALIVKDEAVDNATVILKMGDKEITKETVKAEVQNELDSMAYYYSMMGYQYDTSDPEVIAQAQKDALEALKKDMVLTAKATELGLDTLTEEEEETVKTKAQEDYDNALDYVKTYQLDESGLEGEELDKAAAEKLTEMKISLDTYLESERKSIVDDKVREYIIKDVEISDDEIQAEFDTRVEDDKTKYAESAGTWATAANNGTTLYYTPAGVRRIKQILTKFKDEDQTAIDEAKQQVTDANTAVTAATNKVSSAEDVLKEEDISEEAKTQAEADKAAAEKELEEANAALEAANKAVEDATNKAFENIDADTDAILERLAAGEDWQAVMEEKNQDPGMSSNPDGYAVAAGMTNFDSAFVDAAMALEKIGDYSGKVRGTSYGYYIVRYESDIPEGPVDLDTVKETIRSSLLTTKQNEQYDATVDAWVEAAGITVDENALKD